MSNPVIGWSHNTQDLMQVYTRLSDLQRESGIHTFPRGCDADPSATSSHAIRRRDRPAGERPNCLVNGAHGPQRPNYVGM